MELSIVLAILGILIVATISGKSLIDISRATATIQQLSDRVLAFQIFSSTYDCIPGDCSTTTVTSNLGATGIGNGNNVVEAYVASSKPNELVFVEEHLVKARLFNRTIGTVTAGTTQTAGQNLLADNLTVSKVPGAYISSFSIGQVFYNIVGGASATENVINGIPIAYPGIFKIIDSKVDDSSATTGDIRCETTAPTATFATFVGTTAYPSISTCTLFAKMAI